MSENDAILNDETRRALGWRGRQGGMLIVGAAVAIVLFGVAGLAVTLSIPWQLALALTAGVTVALPLAVPYAMLRVLGLSHQDVLYVGKQAYREAVIEIIALSGTQKTADVFTESNPASVNGALTPDGGESKNDTEDESESTPNAEKTENSSGNEAADTENSLSEVEEMDDETSTGYETTDQPQQTEPEPQS